MVPSVRALGGGGGSFGGTHMAKVDAFRFFTPSRGRAVSVWRRARCSSRRGLSARPSPQYRALLVLNFFEPIYRRPTFAAPPKTRAAIIRHAHGILRVFVARYILGPLSWLCWSSRYRRVLRARTGPNPLSTWLELRGAPRAPPPVLIIYIHGGGFGSHTATEFAFAGEVLPRLASKGVAARVLALDYSLAPQACARAAGAANGRLPAGDGLLRARPRRAGGHSAGGHHALALFLELLDFGPR